MKLKTKLSKLRHDGHITDAEYSIIINVLNKFSTQPPKTQPPKTQQKVEQPCEDAISREEAIRVAEQGKIQGYEWQFKKLCNLQSVTPQQKIGRWIPVEEELPPSYEAVLLYVKYKSSGQWTYQLGMWNDSKLAWEDWRTPYQLEEEFEVIAWMDLWMDLPEPYTE